MISSDVQIYRYNKDSFSLNQSVKADDFNIDSYKDEIQWLNFHGFQDSDLVEESFERFGIHKLTRDDILKLEERPKIEEYENYIYVTLKSIYCNPANQIIAEQISFILTGNTVISYQEKHGDLFDYIRDRIETDKGLVRKKGSDYLLYLLIEATLTGYDTVLDSINAEIIKTNEKLRAHATESIFLTIEEMKENLRDMKNAFHPFRDQILKLINSNHQFIKSQTIPFFNDIRDNILYNVDEFESTKSDLESMSNLYFARMSQKSNEIMQFLTIVAAIFIPLTFVAGVYGMNFDNMPELHTKYGYFFVWGTMIVIALLLIIYFKRKKWF